ncbi:hypothetical protein EW145_g4697 [Phellinidium pouzarii]|uniref:CCHC-type domain-containing protein n=1 Tax=Phellinidium pouzarii TaxID=167371 RepID=A0A4S4L7F0_9AGAM|nr:hypothetical protein EW145_g4697 [Phellinidium pouzarii]
MPPCHPLPTSSDSPDCPSAHTRSRSSTQGAPLPTEPPVNTGTTQPTTTPHTTPHITTPTQTLLETPPETSTPAGDITITYEELRRNLQDIINTPSDKMVPTQTHDHPDAMLIKPQEVTKIFNGVEALEGIKNWKMWIFRITNAIETCGMEKLLLNALTYISAITNAIPLQYKYVLGQLEIHTWAINNYRQSLDPDAHLYVTTPDMLINECWQAFANWQTTNKRQNPITAAHPYRNKTNHPYFRGRGGFRGQGRGGTRGRGFSHGGGNQPGSMRNVKCFNCNKFGHTSPDCRAPLTDATKCALDKKKAQEQAKPAVNNPGNTLAIAAPPPAATATANIVTTSSATIEELPPTPISGSPLTSMMHFANENSLFDFLGEHGADYDINTMEMDHFDVNIGF